MLERRTLATLRFACVSLIAGFILTATASAHDPLDRLAKGQYAGFVDDALRTGWVLALISALLGPALALRLLGPRERRYFRRPNSNVLEPWQHPLVTDKGIPISNEESPPIKDVTKDMKEEDAMVKAFGLDKKVRRTGIPSNAYNCHGHVFGNSATQIGNRDVDPILRDNGYNRVTSKPGKGDLVIYRDGTGAVVHSGVITGLDANGQPIVESKWGTGSLMQHGVKDVPPQYGTGTFYQGRGGTHILREI